MVQPKVYPEVQAKAIDKIRTTCHRQERNKAKRLGVDFDREAYKKCVELRVQAWIKANVMKEEDQNSPEQQEKLVEEYRQHLSETEEEAGGDPWSDPSFIREVGSELDRIKRLSPEEQAKREEENKKLAREIEKKCADEYGYEAE